eukprot:TRINITY_DN2782_c0_g1_i1.p1 TRINITY_DN2782_c0_g1~~TRINITY_DN2782_c0_g1_i1.p1  ORF type:complete len:314 (+),score=91.58 TRINITY_DN2782_c0_g1_i1:119-1060(+)
MAESSRKGKRKVGFTEEDEVRTIPAEKRAHRDEEADDDEDLTDAQKRARAREAAQTHTLESDEEDEGEDEKQTKATYHLTDEDLHENLDSEFADGGYEVTGFNLKDEMEEGHFDETGNFIFKKDEEHEGDNWLAAGQLHNPEKEVKFQGRHVEHSQADIPEDRFELMEALVALLQPQESISRALIRLGGGKQTQPRRRKAGAAASAGAGDLKAVERMTSLANALMTQGVYDIYDYTSEKLMHELKNKSKVLFEYKWSADEDAEVHGPFSAEQMFEWQKQSFFPETMQVRRLQRGSKGPFYPVKRMDFELFIDD